ncbi:MAG TPA: asparagine synthase-related protein, partial [Candidatus Nanoarchaeia archaeon]|nr:asparagine synthase-related protein [Candidatus Nanoarchaeia archaeon]
MTTLLGIIKDGTLVPQETWKKLVISLSTPYDSLETNKERSKRSLSHLLTEAVKKRLQEKNAILFSGGVDSTTLAYLIKKQKGEVTCYTVGIEGSDDIIWARKAAQQNGFILREKTLTLQELEVVVKNVIRLTKSADIVTVGVGSVLYAALAMAKREGFA